VLFFLSGGERLDIGPVLFVKTLMKWIELTDYRVAHSDEGAAIERFSFSISSGDVCWLDAGTPEEAHSFFKVLAMLIIPQAGVYYFKEDRLDFSRPEVILAAKRQIGYITTHSALISNRSLRENLTLTRSYFDNDLSASVDDETFELCRRFSLVEKIDMRPQDLDLIDMRTAIVIRELSKSPQLLLLERPEAYLGHARFGLYSRLVQDLIEKGVPVVFTSDDGEYIDRVTNRTVVLKDGRLNHG